MKKNLKIIIPILITVLLVIIIVAKFQKQSQFNKIQDSICQNLSEIDPIKTVRELPEVRKYLSYFSDETRTAYPSKEPRIIVDSETEGTSTVRVYKIDISEKPSIQTTFNTYIIDKCTGEIICSFVIYDKQGGWVRVSEADECNIHDYEK